jgi:hypothetical protein
MSYTPSEAAAACGLDKSTVRRAVRSGRISSTTDELGAWHVEPAELHRVFHPQGAPRPGTGQRQMPERLTALFRRLRLGEA